MVSDQVTPPQDLLITDLFNVSSVSNLGHLEKESLSF